MKHFFVLLIFALCSCSKPAVDPDPFILIPADFKFIGKVDVPKVMDIPGINSRIIYERKRKPALEVLPLSDLQSLYLAAGSGQQTEENGMLYVCIFKSICNLDEIIADFEKKSKNRKEIIISRNKFEDKNVYQVRDRKQELAICQVGPKTCIAAPLDQLISCLTLGKNNISSSSKLREYMNDSQESCLSLFLLSSENIGAYLQNFQFFDTVQINLKQESGTTLLNIHAECKDEESAQKTAGALTLAQTVLVFSKGKHLRVGDIEVKQDQNLALLTAKFTDAAMIELFTKKKD